jgi:hypothetical protein
MYLKGMTFYRCHSLQYSYKPMLIDHTVYCDSLLCMHMYTNNRSAVYPLVMSLPASQGIDMLEAASSKMVGIGAVGEMLIPLAVGELIKLKVSANYCYCSTY